MFIILLWITPVTRPWSSSDSIIFLDIARTLCLIGLISINILTFKFELEMYMARAYDYIKTLVVDSSDDNLRQVQLQVQARIKVMIMITFQIISKVLIPAVLLIMILQKTSVDYLKPQKEEIYQQTGIYYPDGMVSVSNLNWNGGFV